MAKPTEEKKVTKTTQETTETTITPTQNTPTPAPPVETKQDPPAQETPPEKEETVEISKEKLDTVLTAIEDQEKINKNLKDQVTRLEAAANLGRLVAYDDKNRDKTIIRKAGLSFYRDKIVHGWKTIKDEVGFVDGKLISKQTIEVWLDNGVDEENKLLPPEKFETPLLHFAQNKTLVYGDVVNESKDQKTGSVYWTVEMEDGRKIEIDITYVN